MASVWQRYDRFWQSMTIEAQFVDSLSKGLQVGDCWVEDPFDNKACMRYFEACKLANYFQSYYSASSDRLVPYLSVTRLLGPKALYQTLLDLPSLIIVTELKFFVANWISSIGIINFSSISSTEDMIVLEILVYAKSGHIQNAVKAYENFPEVNELEVINVALLVVSGLNRYGLLM
ncbi:hypothetical protein LXL04_000858 [Taraxacum kok-saghyz]